MHASEFTYCVGKPLAALPCVELPSKMYGTHRGCIFTVRFVFFACLTGQRPPHSNTTCAGVSPSVYSPGTGCLRLAGRHPVGAYAKGSPCTSCVFCSFMCGVVCWPFFVPWRVFGAFGLILSVAARPLGKAAQCLLFLRLVSLAWRLR